MTSTASATKVPQQPGLVGTAHPTPGAPRERISAILSSVLADVDELVETLAVFEEIVKREQCASQASAHSRWPLLSLNDSAVRERELFQALRERLGALGSRSASLADELGHPVQPRQPQGENASLYGQALLDAFKALGWAGRP